MLFYLREKKGAWSDYRESKLKFDPAILPYFSMHGFRKVYVNFSIEGLKNKKMETIIGTCLKAFFRTDNYDGGDFMDGCDGIGRSRNCGARCYNSMSKQSAVNKPRYMRLMIH